MNTESNIGISNNSASQRQETLEKNWDTIKDLFEIEEGDLLGIKKGLSQEKDNNKSETIPSSSVAYALTVTNPVNGVALIAQGSLSVDAAAPRGAWFQNFSEKWATITLSANGRWSCENGIYASANGNPDKKVGNFNKGSLILSRSNKTQEEIGQSKTILLEPMETVYFICNDDLFLDNMGSLTITWTLEKLSTTNNPS